MRFVPKPAALELPEFQECKALKFQLRFLSNQFHSKSNENFTSANSQQSFSRVVDKYSLLNIINMKRVFARCKMHF